MTFSTSGSNSEFRAAAGTFVHMLKDVYQIVFSLSKVAELRGFTMLFVV